MKRIVSFLLAVTMSVAIIGSTVYAEETGDPVNAEGVTSSGISYEDIGSSIDNYIKDRETGLVSCSVSIFDSDGVVYDGYYGYADIENNIPADSETVYEWGSTSKMLVWICVMQQWERGNIDFDEDIRTYLPDGFLTKLQYPDEKITMLDLMSHRAGFQESFYENQEADPDDVYESLEEAVRACECYQAYHVGEFTAYSNWGTALAAYIVEQTSGLDYVTYVQRNIFTPLGMEHSSIDPLQRDNEWVALKRHELKCYCRFADPKDNQDFGECRYAVQLFPAGACMSTLEDLSKLGQAFVTEDCPLFKNNSTRDEMLKATSFYGDSDIAKNCHGLWVQHYKVDTLGHDGNTAGCTANLEFDPESGLGVAILTNEPGETAFCSGIPVLLYGHYTDRESISDYRGKVKDVSGVYYCKRAIVCGAASASQYMDGVFPLSQNSDGTYSVSLCGVTFADGILFTSVGENQYIMNDNGREMFVYIEDDIFEIPFMDYVRSNTGALPTASSYGFIIWGLICILTLMIKLIVTIIRKIRKTERKHTKADSLIVFQQSIYGVSGVIFALFLMIMPTSTPAVVTASSVLVGLLAVLSFVNCVALCFNTVKGDEKIRTKTKQYIWAVLCLMYCIFTIGMQLYCFWKL